MPVLVIASGNRHKVAEIGAMLAAVDLEVRQQPDGLEIEETGLTYAENARLKASTVAALTGCWSLADDSGLEVDALDGRPGLHSARYAPTDHERIHRLLQELGVPWQASDMSFSVKCDRTGLEYNGTNLDKLFAQRSNLLRPSFWRMVRDILRFYREAEKALDPAAQEETLGGYLERGGYSEEFIAQHMIPMGAAIWSTCPEEMLAFPLRFLVQFFHNHGFLQVDGRPQWLVVEGGSRSYVEPLVRPFGDRIRLQTPVHAVTREPDGRVRVQSAGGGDELFDRVVMATHSDTTQRLLKDATPLEREVLSGFAYQANEVVLHTDTSLMPRRRRAWASCAKDGMCHCLFVAGELQYFTGHVVSDISLVSGSALK